MRASGADRASVIAVVGEAGAETARVAAVGRAAAEGAIADDAVGGAA